VVCRLAGWAGCPREWVTIRYADVESKIPFRQVHGMSVQIRFVQSGSFHAGEFKSLDLDKISRFQITRQRNTCELLATTPENPQPNTPFMLARRDNEYELQAILTDLRQLKTEQKKSVYRITDTEAGLVVN
jgi:hypothetical protein